MNPSPSPAAPRLPTRRTAPGRFRPAMRPLAALLALLQAGGALAHDWTSPGADAAAATQARQAPPARDWPGLVWRGPRDGAPPEPAVEYCRRAPLGVDLPAPGGGAQTRPRHSRPGVARSAEPETAAALDGEVLRAERAEAPVAALPGPGPESRSPSRARGSGPGVADPALAAAPAATADKHAGAHHAEAPAPRGPAPEPSADAAQADPARVSAGMVDDNADFRAFLDFRERHAGLPVRPMDVRERYRLVVHDADGRPVPDARVRVMDGGRWLPLWARTDAGGEAWLHPRVAGAWGATDEPASAWASPAAWPGEGLSPPRRQPQARPEPQRLQVQVRSGSGAQLRQGSAWLQRGQRDDLQIRLDGRAAPQPSRLDLVFLVDATGSMADEIDKLAASMRAMAAQIARLPGQPDLCFGLVAYRDRGDAFFVRQQDFTNDLDAFQGSLAALRADGGGDYPEALDAGLHAAVHRLSWRGEGTTRLIVLVGDAPPHLQRGPGPAPRYDDDLRAALSRGIKLLSIGASGLDSAGETVFRQAAQFTGGRFVFLTYADARDPSSGPGRETVHEVERYSVESLDRLIVRLVREELARRPA